MTLLTDLQDDIENRLRTCPEFDHVSIQVLAGTSAGTEATLREQIRKAVTGENQQNGKGGLAVLILLPRVRIETGMQGVPGPQIQLALGIQVIEFTTWNEGEHGTGISSQSLAVTTLSLLHLFQPRGGVILMAAEEAITPAEVPDDMGADIAWEVGLVSPMSTQPCDKVPAPTLDVSAGLFSITAGALGAEHWFSLDGTYPRPNAPTAHLYAAPVSVTAGTLIRAASYHPDFVGSDIMEKTA
ncbi:MAG: hypothetical protein V4662_12080 [Verrucomicrobiota bacterium]